LKDKHSTLDIDAELSVTLAALPLTISGAASFYKETKKYASSAALDIAYLYTIGTLSLTTDKAQKRIHDL